MSDTLRVRALFERARNVPLKDRLAFVQREAGNDGELANEVLFRLGQLTMQLGDGGASPTEHEENEEKVSLCGEGVGDSAVLDAIKNRESPSDRYRYVKEIDKGGMGRVSLVRDLDLRRPLAMKVMLDESSDLLPRFIEEAQVMGQLDHPNIVPVHELGFDAEGHVFFTMKLVKGETLRHVFDKVLSGVDDWNVTRVLSVILRVCEALAFAHAKGVIHRDLKPGNIMVGRFGEVYVMDWGLARVLGEKDSRDLRLRPDESISIVKTERQDKKSGDTPDSPAYTMDGTVVGTPSFMPPEQAEGLLELVGPRSDVYAIGALLYRLLAGRDPYSEPDQQLGGRQIVLRVVAGPPRPLHELVTDVPAELLAIQEKAMARRIDERYPSMNELADDLRAYLEHRVVSAYETGAIAELKKWVERNKGLAAAAALLLLVLAGASVLFAAKNREIQAKNLALGHANVEITTQKAAVDAKNREVETRNKELLDANSLIQQQKAEVEERGAEVARRKAQFDQLAGVVKLENAKRAEKALYPAWPNKSTAMENWLRTDAQELLELKPALAATRIALESGATRAGEGDATSFSFPDPAQAFLHSALTRLSKDIATFEATTRAEVEKRLAWARRIGDLTLHHPKARIRWEEARAAIAKADDVVASKLYASSPGGPIDLKPQMGLVPIGMNPVTKLWEFYDLRSACDVAAGQDPASLEIPTFEPDGRVLVKPETGIILVFLPGGTFLQGAQKKAEKAPNYDPRAGDDESVDGHPVSVTLRPFFISKYEMTQGQWLRLSGTNPSFWMSQYPTRTGLDRPIELISWDECFGLCLEFGLELPTEARWEYACRAGTSDVFSFRMDEMEMATHGNFRDIAFARTIPNIETASCESFDDGEAIPCAVGQYAPNDFGLCDVHGNAWEWCQDAYGPYSQSTRDGDGLREPRSASLRIYRGGGYESRVDFARSAFRNYDAADRRNDYLGARVARSLSSD